MQPTLAGKILIVVLVAGLGYGGWKALHRGGDGNTGGSGTGTGGPVPILRVGVVTWPGYCGGIVANNGFKPTEDCIFYRNHKIKVKFDIMEDVDARAKLFQKGDVDIVWSTVDFWANELPGFIKGGTKAKAIMQVDWSRGGDAIVADNSIRRIEDLRGKKIALALFTPSHWLLEYNLSHSSLDETEQSKIVKSLVGKTASPDAREVFVAGKVDAAVVWEPDVTEALKKRPNSHILTSSKYASKLIADLMVAREDFISQHPDWIKAFVQGWFDGTTEANKNPSLAVKLLMENEPLYKDLGEAATRDQLSTVKYADLTDNTEMFGLNGKPPLFDSIFQQASEAWIKRGYITTAVAPAEAKADRFLKEIYDLTTVKPDPPPDPHLTTKPDPEKLITTDPVRIVFASGSASLDDNAKQILDKQVATLVKSYSNAYIFVEGNTDSVGDPHGNDILSQARAKSAVAYLVAKYSFNAQRIISIGNGQRKPVATNATAEGKQKNRRTDIKVVPPASIPADAR